MEGGGGGGGGESILTISIDANSEKLLITGRIAFFLCFQFEGNVIELALTLIFYV